MHACRLRSRRINSDKCITVVILIFQRIARCIHHHTPSYHLHRQKQQHCTSHIVKINCIGKVWPDLPGGVLPKISNTKPGRYIHTTIEAKPIAANRTKSQLHRITHHHCIDLRYLLCYSINFCTCLKRYKS